MESAKGRVYSRESSSNSHYIGIQAHVFMLSHVVAVSGVAESETGIDVCLDDVDVYKNNTFDQADAIANTLVPGDNTIWEKTIMKALGKQTVSICLCLREMGLSVSHLPFPAYSISLSLSLPIS